MSEAGSDSARRDGGSRHVVLVGLPGAGKSTVGRLLAGLLARPFIDFDEEIVRREGRTISSIFESDGEAYFRCLEAALTAEVLHSPPAVISPGGGWIMEQGLAEMLRPGAVFVHLRATPQAALRRMGAASAERPLLTDGDELVRISELWEARRGRYALADVEVDTETLDAEEVASAVLELIDRSTSGV